MTITRSTKGTDLPKDILAEYDDVTAAKPSDLSRGWMVFPPGEMPKSLIVFYDENDGAFDVYFDDELIQKSYPEDDIRSVLEDEGFTVLSVSPRPTDYGLEFVVETDKGTVTANAKIDTDTFSREVVIQEE